VKVEQVLANLKMPWLKKSGLGLSFNFDGLVKSLQNANSRNVEVNNFKCLQSRELRFSTFYETINFGATKKQILIKHINGENQKYLH
jgi:hypothetical protein